MSKLARTILAFIGLTLLGATAVSAALVCRLPAIAGLEDSLSRGKHFVGATTSDPNKLKIYAEYTDRGVYYQSNFLSEGAENPTKILTKEPVALDVLVQNLLFSSSEEARASSVNMGHLMETLDLQVDQSMFDANGYMLADLQSARRITFVDARAGQSLPASEHISLTMLKPPPFAMAGRVTRCCVFGIPPFEAANFSRDLAALPFNKDRFKVMSLVRDSGTEKALKQPVLQNSRVGPEVQGITSPEQVYQEVRAQAGNQIAILGHVEGSDFVIRAPDGAVQVTIPVAQLVREADRAGTSLMLVGCRTARQINDGAKGFGIVESFNSVTASNAIARAIQGSTNHRDFLQALSSTQFNLVIDRKYILSQRRVMAVAVYSKGRGSSIRRRIADLVFLLPRGWRGAEKG